MVAISYHPNRSPPRHGAGQGHQELSDEQGHFNTAAHTHTDGALLLSAVGNNGEPRPVRRSRRISQACWMCNQSLHRQGRQVPPVRRNFISLRIAIAKSWLYTWSIEEIRNRSTIHQMIPMQKKQLNMKAANMVQLLK